MTEKCRVIGENHWLSVSHRQNLSHKIKYTMRHVEYLIFNKSFNIHSYYYVLTSNIVHNHSRHQLFKKLFFRNSFSSCSRKRTFLWLLYLFMTLFNQNKFFVKFMTQKIQKTIYPVAWKSEHFTYYYIQCNLSYYLLKKIIL